MTYLRLFRVFIYGMVVNLMGISAVADHSLSACLASFPATTDAPSAIVEVTILSVRPNSDMEGDDDNIPFYDNKADIYGRVTINGITNDLPQISEDNHPHWDEHPPTIDLPRGGVFRVHVPIIADSSGMAPLPVPISIEIRESDGGLTGDDDVVDISPLPDDSVLDFEFDLCRMDVRGDINNNGTQTRIVVPAGADKNDAELIFTVKLEDGRPVSVEDIALMDFDLIQVLPNVSRLAAGKPTVARVRVANNFSHTVETDIELRIVGARFSQIIERFDLPTLEPGQVETVLLNPDNPFIFPDIGEQYTVFAIANVDPDRTLPDTARALPGDCRAQNNGANLRTPWSVVPMHTPRLVWAKVGMDLDLGNFVLDSQFDELVSTGEAYIHGVFPVAELNSSKSVIDLPLFVTPGVDWLRQIIPGTDAVDPFLMVATLSTLSAQFGIERTMGVLPNKDWFKRFEGWSSVTGLSMGINFPNAVIFVPIKESASGNGPSITLPAHELGHTYRLSTDTKIKNDWACSLNPGIGDLLCGAFRGFDEYTNEDEPYKTGNPTNGVWLKQGGEPQNILDLIAAGPEQCDSHCFMGSTRANDLDPTTWSTKGRWIDRADYDELFDRLKASTSSNLLGAELIQISGMLAIKGEYIVDGETVEVDESDGILLHVGVHPTQSTAVPDVIHDTEAAVVGEIRFLDGAENVVGSEPIFAAALSSHGEDQSEGVELPITAFSRLVNLPESSVKLELRVLAEDGRTSLLVQRELGNEAPTVTSLEVEQLNRNTVLMSWLGQAERNAELNYSVAISPDQGQNWWPVAANLTSSEVSISTADIPKGTYLTKVFANDGGRSSFSEPVRFSLN